MKALLWLPLFIGLITCAGCTESLFEREDKKTVQTQLHLPNNIRYLSFQSYPRNWGWFGREGLWIRAEIEFNEHQFKRYVQNINKASVWKPVRFHSYSPSIAENYTRKSLSWSDLPLPDSIKSRLWRNSPLTPNLIDSENGTYYCSVIAYLQVAPPDRNARPPYTLRKAGWRHVGRACTELSDPDSATIYSIGILDFDTRQMSVYIQFSG